MRLFAGYGARRAGSLTTVIIDVATGEASFEGVNAAGRLTGGFADVYLDVDGDGAGDLQVEDDVFLAASHSGKSNPGPGRAGRGPPGRPRTERLTTPWVRSRGLTDKAAIAAGHKPERHRAVSSPVPFDLTGDRLRPGSKPEVGASKP